MPRRLLHTMIRVTNLQKSIEFYKDVLGMRLLRQWDVPEDKYTLAFLGYGTEMETAVVELTYNYGTHSYTHGDAYGHIAIGVEDVNAMVQSCKDKGVTIDYDSGDGFMAFIVDPDGYRIEILNEKKMMDCAKEQMESQKL